MLHLEKYSDLGLGNEYWRAKYCYFLGIYNTVLFYSVKSFARARPSIYLFYGCLLYTSPSPRDRTRSRMPSSA